MVIVKNFMLETPIGDLQIMIKGDVIILCEFADRTERITRHLDKYYDDAEIVNIVAPLPIKTIFDSYFGGESNNFCALPIAPAGSPYQLRVWNYLQTIPSGSTQSYGEMAKNLGSSPRAVGGANGRNTIALIVPCHRVIGADGALTGYAGGIERKQWLLRHEGAI